MSGLLRAARAMDGVSRFFALIAATLVLASCLISAGNAISRYLFSISSNAWLEVQWQMFAGMFLLGAAHVLKLNEHVRVDLFFGSASPRRKLWIDVFGIIFFLVPAMTVLAWSGWTFFLPSLISGEHSSNSGGLLLWPVKLLMPVGFTLVLFQGLAELVKRIAALRGELAPVPEYGRPLQ